MQQNMCSAGLLQGVAAVSLQWGAWGGGGMAAADKTLAARLARAGMGMLPPAAGLAALTGALSFQRGKGQGHREVAPLRSFTAGGRRRMRSQNDSLVSGWQQ